MAARCPEGRSRIPLRRRIAPLSMTVMLGLGLTAVTAAVADAGDATPSPAPVVT